MDCHVGGEPASAFGMSGDLATNSGTIAGQFINVYVVHNYYLYEIDLIGTGGIGDHAIGDSLAMLGSLRWTI